MNKSIFKKGNRYKIFIHLFFVLLSLLFILPLVMVVSISFSSEAAVTNESLGYSLFPREFSLDAYRKVFKNPDSIIDAYILTAFVSVAGTAINVVSAGMCGYALSRVNFRYKKIVSFVVFFTMLFGGGAIPTYIVYTKYYHLGNSIWIYLLPALNGGAMTILMIRTFCRGIPESLFESAKIDGARELTIFFKIALPLSKPVIATVAFGGLVSRWNNWATSMVYIRDPKLYTLQYLLQRILNDAQFLKNIAEDSAFIGSGIDLSTVLAEPTETLKYAMCVVAAGPMLLVFPFFQKYFEKGMVVGSVKG